MHTLRTFFRIFSYVAIIALSIQLLTVFVFYTEFKEVVIAETYKKSIDLLRQTESVFDSLYSWIIPSFLQIRTESTVSGLTYSDRLDNLQISRGLDRLDELFASNLLLQSLYIYNDRRKEFFSTINGYEAGECSDFALPNILSNIDAYGVYRLVPRKMTYRIHDNVFRGGFTRSATENVFTVVVGNPPKPARVIGGALIVNISEQKVRRSLLGADAGGSGDLLIVSDKGIVLTHPDKNMFAADLSSSGYVRRILADTKDEGRFVDTIDGSRYLVSFVTHPIWGWRFINITPYEKTLSGLNSLLRHTVVIFLALMVIALLLSVASSLRIYLPIHRFFAYSLSLRDKYRGPAPDADQGKLTELQYVDRTFKYIVQRVDAFENDIGKNADLYRHVAWKALLLGDMEAEEFANHPDTMRGRSPAGPFILSIVRIDDFDRFSEAHTQEEIGRVFRIIWEMTLHYGPAAEKLFLPVRKDHACVVYNFEGGEASPEEVRQSYRTIQSAVQRELGCAITVGMSEVLRRHADFPDAYEKTLGATQLRFRHGRGSLISVGEATQTAEAAYVFPEQKLKRLLADLRSGRMPELERVIGDLVDEVKDHGYEDFVHMTHLLTYHTGRFIEEIAPGLGEDHVILRGLLSGVKALETLSDVKSWLVQICTLVFDLVQKGQSGKTRETALKLKEHIDHGYRDPALCADSLSVLTGLSSNYIRFIFKKTHGVSVAAYVNSVRLEFCKEQLLTTKNAIATIYQSAGYTNYNYFFTLFKKETGMTPARYRINKIR